MILEPLPEKELTCVSKDRRLWSACSWPDTVLGAKSTMINTDQ